MTSSWPPDDHWAIRTKRRRVTTALVTLIVCLVATALSWSDFSGVGNVIVGVLAPIGIACLGYALIATLRRP